MSSPTVIWVRKSRRMRRARHIAHTGDRRSANGSGGETRGIETSWRTKVCVGGQH